LRWGIVERRGISQKMMMMDEKQPPEKRKLAKTTIA
jgi:hypothetical protein